MYKYHKKGILFLLLLSAKISKNFLTLSFLLWKCQKRERLFFLNLKVVQKHRTEQKKINQKGAPQTEPCCTRDPIAAHPRHHPTISLAANSNNINLTTPRHPLTMPTSPSPANCRRVDPTQSTKPDRLVIITIHQTNQAQPTSPLSHHLFCLSRWATPQSMVSTRLIDLCCLLVDRNLSLTPPH